MKESTSIDAYIKTYPESVQVTLNKLRVTIQNAAPHATETIKYGIPTFVLGGNLVHFGAYKNHIGFYPAPSGIRAFEKKLSSYKQSQGAVQFPLDKPIPLSIVTKIVRYRVKENLSKIKETSKLK